MAEASTTRWQEIESSQLRPSRSLMVCITCQQFRHALTTAGTTIPACSRHQRLLPQGSHLSHRCHQWTQRLERRIGWCPEES